MADKMMEEDYKSRFLDAALAWVCNEYYLDVRYFCVNRDGHYKVVRCSIDINPLAPSVDNSFQFKSKEVLLGQTQNKKLNKKDLISLIKDASNGKIVIEGEVLVLEKENSFDYYSEMIHGENWFYILHLRVDGKSLRLSNPFELLMIDNMLRMANPPFDGLNDALTWMGFDGSQSLGSRSSDINIRINPPVNLIFEKSFLTEDELNIYLISHPEFDIRQVGLAVRPVPGISVNSRKQLAPDINWSSDEDGYKKGELRVSLQNADSALLMLMIGNNIVRRQWILDAGKARNNRYLAVQHFDRELKMAKKFVFENSDSAKFENGVALLLFMLGFTPSVQAETDSPDLIVSTPEGQLIIVECTTRISDFSAKVGKLVDRRGDLKKALLLSEHHSMVHAILVCRLPKDQIATSDSELNDLNVILWTQESLKEAFEQVRFGSNPDSFIKKSEILMKTTTRGS